MGLLDRLAWQTGCIYLSDLHWKDKLLLAVCIRTFPAEAYTLHEWIDAVQYLLKIRAEFASAENAKKFLLQSCEL